MEYVLCRKHFHCIIQPDDTLQKKHVINVKSSSLRASVYTSSDGAFEVMLYIVAVILVFDH